MAGKANYTLLQYYMNHEKKKTRFFTEDHPTCVHGEQRSRTKYLGNVGRDTEYMCKVLIQHCDFFTRQLTSFIKQVLNVLQKVHRKAFK